jgi:hypothetical protein
MNNLDELKELIGINFIRPSTVKYILPDVHDDALYSGDGMTKYVISKSILEHEKINPILEHMKAFESINKYDINSYYDMAASIANVISLYNSENDEEDHVNLISNIDNNFNVNDINEFEKEFLIEFYKNRFRNLFDIGMKNKNNVEDNIDNNIEDDDEDVPQFKKTKNLNIKQKDYNFIEKLLRKLGIHADIGIKDFIYLYLIQKFSNSGEEEFNQPSLSKHTVESFEQNLFLELPLAVEGLVESVKEEFINLYDNNWINEVYNELDNTYKLIEKDEASLDKDHLNDLNIDQTTIKVSKPDKDVIKDVKNRISELEKLISDYDDKKHFQGEVKPIIFNTRDALKYLLDKITSDNTLHNYKEVQIYFQKLMSPITDLFPPRLVKYLSMEYKSEGK